ncbi:MAG: hypothetical protein IH898_09755 [Planctomycetes bacterium]|nr:hypothetical protein [Planctomycetota bacterium]
MANTISGMTPSEFRELVEAIVENAVERKLVELLAIRTTDSKFANRFRRDSFNSSVT